MCANNLRTNKKYYLHKSFGIVTPTDRLIIIDYPLKKYLIKLPIIKYEREKIGKISFADFFREPFY